MTAPRRSRAGGGRKKPARYESTPPSATLALAMRHHRYGRLREAIDVYVRAADEAPRSIDVWANLGTAYAAAGRASLAKEAFERALGLSADARMLRDVGAGLRSVGALGDARVAMERATERDPALLGAHLALARLCLDTGDAQGAVHSARRAIAVAPESAPAHLELAYALFDDHDVLPSLRAAEAALRFDPDYAVARELVLGARALEEGLRLPTNADGAEADTQKVDADYLDGLRLVLSLASEGARVFSTKREGLLFSLRAARDTGPIFEFGVRHGVSTRLLAQSGADVHAFDSFEGLPLAWARREAGVFSTGGELPGVPHNVTLHRGLFSETLPTFLAEHAAAPRLVHVDSDLYESAREVLSLVGPRLGVGAVLVFDEYVGHRGWRGDEYRALDEARAAFGWDLQCLAASFVTGQAVMRIRGLR